MKKEISTERSGEQGINIPYHIRGFVSIYSQIVLDFVIVFGSLRIVFQMKFSREFGKVSGNEVKKLQ